MGSHRNRVNEEMRDLSRLHIQRSSSVSGEERTEFLPSNASVSFLFQYRKRIRICPCTDARINAVVNIPSVRQTPFEFVPANPIKSRIEERSGIPLYGHDRCRDFMDRRAPKAREKLAYRNARSHVPSISFVSRMRTTKYDDVQKSSTFLQRCVSVCIFESIPELSYSLIESSIIMDRILAACTLRAAYSDTLTRETDTHTDTHRNVHTLPVYESVR